MSSILSLSKESSVGSFFVADWTPEGTTLKKTPYDSYESAEQALLRSTNNTSPNKAFIVKICGEFVKTSKYVPQKGL